MINDAQRKQITHARRLVVAAPRGSIADAIEKLDKAADILQDVLDGTEPPTRKPRTVVLL